jgi:hypothetical protein
MVSGAWEHRGWQELEPPSRIKASKVVFNEHQVGTPKSKIKKTQGTTTYLPSYTTRTAMVAQLAQNACECALPARAARRRPHHY